MYRSPLLSERRRVLPGGGSGGALYYPHGNGGSARPARAQRFASLVLLAAITLGALAAQKVLVCDVAAAEGAQRETALVDSLKRLQGSLAARNAQGGASYTAYQGTQGASLAAPEKVRYDRRIQEKEIAAQRAKKDAAAARAEADECTAQLQALAAGGTGADGAATAAAAAAAALGSGRAEAKRLRAQLAKGEKRAAATASRERALQEALDAARAEAAALRAQLAAAGPLPDGAPEEGGWAGPLDPEEGSTEEGVREGVGADAAEGAPKKSAGAAEAKEAAKSKTAAGEAGSDADGAVHGRSAHGRAPGDAKKLTRQNARRWPPGGADAEDAAGEADGARDRGGEEETEAEAEEDERGSSSEGGGDPTPLATEDRSAV